MTSTEHQVGSALTTASRNEHRSNLRTLFIAVLALAVLTVAVASWQLMTTSTPHAPAPQTTRPTAGQMAPYQPGGSVYQQQVPGQGR